MPIPVLCPACKARFQVSEKFAGKQGPCPKCKAPITIPKLEDQIQVHAPEEFAAGGKTTTGQAALKPIARKQTRFELVPTMIAVCGALAVLAIAAVGGQIFKDIVPLRVVALLAISVPLAAAGYALLREEELEPHRGMWFWVRAGLCGLAYTALWCGYYFIPVDMRSTAWSWFFIAPALFGIGAGAAFVCFDLDFGNGFFHYAFYVMATIAVGWLAHLEMPWTAVTGK